MPKNDIDTQIRACIDSFAEELGALIHRAALQSVMDALGGAAAPARRGPGRPRKAASAPTARTAPRRKKRGRRSSADVGSTAAAATAYVKSHSGCTVGDIAGSLGLSTKDLRLPLQKLIAGGRIKTTGQKRGTRYHTGSGRKRKKAGKKRARRAAKKTTKKKAGRKKVTRKKRGSKKG